MSFFKPYGGYKSYKKKRKFKGYKLYQASEELEIKEDEKNMSILNSSRMQKYRIVGVSFSNDDGTSRQEILSKVTEKSKITLVREPKNKYDKNAVAVYADGKQCGYLASYYAGLMAPKLDAGDRFETKVDECGIYKNKYFLGISINPLD